MKKCLFAVIMALLLPLMVPLSVWAEAQPSPPPPNEPVQVDFRHGHNHGSLTLRYWYGNNSIDQWFKGSSLDAFVNTKISNGILSVATDYWFGIVNPEGLGFLGNIFGMGLNMDYADQLVQNVRLVTYWLDFQFAKIALFHDPDWNHSLVLSGHYSSYFNSIYNSLTLTSAAPFFGVGLGLQGKHLLGTMGQLDYKFLYIPSARAPTPLPDGMGLTSEINTRWFITQTLAFNLGYRFNYYRSSGPSQAVSTLTSETITINRTLVDMYHGIIIGLTNYF